MQVASPRLEPRSATAAPRRRGEGRLRLAAGAAAALLLAGCFDEPVREELELAFDSRGAVEVRLTQRLSSYHLERGSPRLQRRLRQTQRTWVDGWDAWPLRFDRARPAEETFGWERSDGEVLTVERTARLTEPDALQRFFSDVLGAVYTFDGAGGGLAFYPASSVRATAAERQWVERALAEWCAAVARYLADTDRLYAYLEAHPGRADALFARLFADAVHESEPAVLGDDEEALVARVKAGMEAVTAVLAVPPDDAFTLDELARLVYDPFPARLRVTVPGSVGRVEGFVRDGDGGFVVPGIGLWDAYAALEGRWLSPDPALLWAELNRSQDGGRPPGAGDDDDEEEEGPRRLAPPPSEREVRRALEAGLRPAPVYSIAWSSR